MASGDLVKLPLTQKFGSLLELTRDELACLEAIQNNRKHLSANETLIEEGQEFSQVHAVISGWCMRHRELQDGRRQIINLQLPGDLVGHFGTVTKVSDHSVMSITDLEVSSFEPTELVDLFGRCPRLAIVFAWIVGRDDLIVSEQVLRLGRLSAYKRTAHLCIELLERLNARGLSNGGDTFELPLTQEMLADALGLSAVHMSRTMSALRKDGLITARGKMIRVESVERLRSITDAASNFSSNAPLPRDVERKLEAMPI